MKAVEQYVHISIYCCLLCCLKCFYFESTDEILKCDQLNNAIYLVLFLFQLIPKKKFGTLKFFLLE